jgi:dolichol kinase
MFLFPLDEIKRKSFHLLILLYIIAYWLLARNIVLWGFGILISFVVVGELLRLRMPVFNAWLLDTLGGIHREEETKKLSGLPWTLSGSFLTILLFPNKTIVLVSFFYLVFGDAIAALAGKRFGRHHIVGEKTLEGSIACLLVCFVAGVFFFGWQMATLGALCATVIELVPWPMNDNFWMPLFSASILTLLWPLFR